MCFCCAKGNVANFSKWQFCVSLLFYQDLLKSVSVTIKIKKLFCDQTSLTWVNMQNSQFQNSQQRLFHTKTTQKKLSKFCNSYQILQLITSHWPWILLSQHGLKFLRANLACVTAAHSVWLIRLHNNFHILVLYTNII